MKRIGFPIALLLVLVFNLKAQQAVKIEINTERGSILAELYPEKAPLTCANFIEYIEAHKFDSASFYRVVRMDNQPNNDVKIEVIQGGISRNRSVPAFAPIKHETTQETGILHKDGILSMARVGPGTATAEFFICVGDQPSLDFGGNRNPDGQGFAAFGRVIKGMDIVREIQQLEDRNQMLVKGVKIYSISILK